MVMEPVRTLRVLYGVAGGGLGSLFKIVPSTAFVSSERLVVAVGLARELGSAMAATP